MGGDKEREAERDDKRYEMDEEDTTSRNRVVERDKRRLRTHTHT
jgi:hypothetical protein